MADLGSAGRRWRAAVELFHLCVHIGRKRVARLKRFEGLVAVSHRRKRRCWKPDTATHEDLVKRAGWSLSVRITAEIVVDALEMARWRRRPEPGTVVHADRGAQYTSWLFGHRLRQAGLCGSMGRVASSVDNALIESFWSTMQRELLDRTVWDSRAQLASAIFEWMEPDPIFRTPTLRR